MTRLVVWSCAVLLSGAPYCYGQRLTTADPNFDSLSQLATSIGWYQVSSTKAWSVGDADTDGLKGAHCMAALDKLRAAGVPDTRSLEIQWDGPEFKRGVHTLAEIRTSCEHVDRIGKIKLFEKWAILAMQEAPKVNSGREQTDFFRLCEKTYEQITKAGVSPTDRVPEQNIGGTEWSGTIEELRKKWCDTGMSKATGNATAAEAPFRKEMSGDKLRLALKYRSFFLVGGAGTGDAHRLAGASVWFLDLSPPRVCTNGLQVHTIRRYAFDSAQKLLKTTERDYCGGAPRAAFQ